MSYNLIMFEIRRISPFDYSEQLIELSKLWAEEDITSGLVPNGVSDLKEPCFAAFSKGRILGYAFGHFYEAEKKINAIAPGSKCFEIDEIFVLKEHRNKGIGKRLFQKKRKGSEERSGVYNFTDIQEGL